MSVRFLLTNLEDICTFSLSDQLFGKRCSKRFQVYEELVPIRRFSKVSTSLKGYTSPPQKKTIPLRQAD